IYPDFVIISGLIKTNLNTDGLIRIYGLDPSKFYNVYFMGNTPTLAGTSVMEFSIGDQSISKTIGGNNYQLVDLVEFKDFSAGQTSVDILITKLSGAYYAGLCSMVIEVNNNLTQILETPVLTSIATG